MRYAARSSILVVVAMTAFTFTARSQTDSQDPSALFQELRGVVTRIMNGEDDASLRKSIHPDAYIIHGSRYVSLFEVLGGNARKQVFTHGEASGVNMLRGWMNDARNTACLILQSGGTRLEEARYQTVIFVRSVGAGWQITHWHAGA